MALDGMGKLEITNIVNGVFRSMTYIIAVGNGESCWLVDCGDVGDIIRSGREVNGVFLTHTHYDHIYGLNDLIDVFPDVRVYTNNFGFGALSDPRKNMSRYHPDVEDYVFKHENNVVIVNDGDRITLSDGVDMSVMYTPGHDPSCLSYTAGGALFTGDAYIPGIKTITSFPNSDKLLAKETVMKIEMELSRYEVFAGHYIGHA